MVVLQVLWPDYKTSTFRMEFGPNSLNYFDGFW